MKNNGFYINMQVDDVTNLLSKKYNIDIEKAKIIFFSSDEYKLLLDEETELWTESPYYVLEDFEKEFNKKGIKIN